ncbi:hypothetical protein N9L47_05575 [Rhodobacteraceae bacterium]|nr:hypothetical protein [Paracoccaceae bacterium]
MDDDPSVIAGTFKSRRLLKHSETALEDVLAAFDLMSERILNGEEDVTLAEISKSRSHLGYVRAQLVEEVNRHEKRIFHSEGLVADAPLDFDAIRSSVGGKLDRIRDARDAEGVSGEFGEG